MISEFHSDALNNWAIRPWVQLAVRANFIQLLQFHLFGQCSCFISVFVFFSRHICFKQSLAQVITLVVKWIDTYGIHHCMIFRSSYRKLAWVVFEPTTSEFRSDALTNWTIRPWVQLTVRANFIQLLQFDLFFQCSRFISVFAFVSCHIFWWSLIAYYIRQVDFCNKIQRAHIVSARSKKSILPYFP